MQHIENGWKQIERRMTDPATSQRQLDEMRMLFFLGATHMLEIIMNLSREDIPKLSDQEVMTTLNDITMELRLALEVPPHVKH
jgi:hypothetical protein